MKIPLVNLKAQHNAIKGEMDAVIADIVENSAFIGGKYLKEFESNFASYCGAKHCVGTASGTSALYLALKASGIKEGDEIITTPYTFIATVGAITDCGAKVKFADVDQDYLIDTNKIKSLITDKTKAIVPVHLYGQHANMDRIFEIAKENNLLVIEDAAQAHGAEYNGKKSPLQGTCIYSFYPAKNLGAIGDAGCIVTNDDEVAEKARLLLNHGRSTKYEHRVHGSNYRLDALQAAILNIKLKYLDKWVAQRRKNAQIYNNLLNNIVTTPKEKPYNKHAYHLYVIRTKNRDKLREFLSKHEIDSGVHYPIPLHLQPVYQYLGHKQGDFPLSEEFSNEVLSLPMCPELTEEQISFICEKIKEFSQNETA